MYIVIQIVLTESQNMLIFLLTILQQAIQRLLSKAMGCHSYDARTT